MAIRVYDCHECSIRRTFFEITSLIVWRYIRVNLCCMLFFVGVCVYVVKFVYICRAKAEAVRDGIIVLISGL